MAGFDLTAEARTRDLDSQIRIIEKNNRYYVKPKGGEVNGFARMGLLAEESQLDIMPFFVPQSARKKFRSDWTAIYA